MLFPWKDILRRCPLAVFPLFMSLALAGCSSGGGGGGGSGSSDSGSGSGSFTAIGVSGSQVDLDGTWLFCIYDSAATVYAGRKLVVSGDTGTYTGGGYTDNTCATSVTSTVPVFSISGTFSSPGTDSYTGWDDFTLSSGNNAASAPAKQSTSGNISTTGTDTEINTPDSTKHVILVDDSGSANPVLYLDDYDAYNSLDSSGYPPHLDVNALAKQ